MKVEPLSTKDFQPAGAQQAAPATKFTNEQMRDELAREINLRRTVYPGQVRAGRLTQDKADRQTAIMVAIWEDYAQRAQADRDSRAPQLPLSGTQPAPTAPPAAVDTVTGTVAQEAPQTPVEQPKPQDPKPAEQPAQPAAPEREPETASTVAKAPVKAPVKAPDSGRK